jgi:carboxymethylenebutenolidase
MAVTEINITASGGGNIPCMAAFPSGGPATAVVAVPSIFGVNDDMAMVAERLAGEGYIAIIPDPFWRDEDPGIIGHDEEGRARAFARMGRTPFEQAFGDVTDVINDLRARDDCNGKVAVMGFCYGGPFALVAAAKCGIQAGFSYHGSFMDKYLDAMPDVSCPLSFHWGDNDRAAPMPVIDEVKQTFTARDDAEVFLYPGGVEHGYMLPGHGEAYNHTAAELSWGRTFSLLKEV